MRRLHPVLLTAVTAGALTLALPPLAGASVTCAYDPAAKVVSGPLQGDLGALFLRQGQAIYLQGDDDPVRCGAATLGNTTRLELSGAGASLDTIDADHVGVSESGGP